MERRRPVAHYAALLLGGGTFHDATGAGVYAIDMSRSPTDNAAISGTIGFRCAM